MHLESRGYSPISALPLAHHVPGRMASSSHTLNYFPPQSLCPCCSLYQVCCSPNSSCGCSCSGGLPFSGTSRDAFCGQPKQKHPLAIFSRIKPFSFRPCIIICNYTHVCAYLVNVCLLHKDWSSTSGCHICAVHTAHPAPCSMPGTERNDERQQLTFPGPSLCIRCCS